VKTRCLPVTTKQLILVVLFWIFLPFAAMAKETTALDRQLIKAINNGDEAETKRLPDEGADVNAEDERGNSPAPRGITVEAAEHLGKNKKKSLPVPRKVWGPAPKISEFVRQFTKIVGGN
jgi:hypothetical protein